LICDNLWELCAFGWWFVRICDDLLGKLGKRKGSVRWEESGRFVGLFGKLLIYPYIQYLVFNFFIIIIRN